MPVMSLDDPRATDATHVGAKAATLAAVRASGFLVPDGWVIPAEDANRMLDDRAFAKGIVDAILESLGDVAVAVRSSATTEDLSGASFAGIYETTLDVVGTDRVIEAIAHCVASAASERVARYRGTDAAPVPAVLVQAMVPADHAGVAFSVDPVTGEDHAVVSAVAGLADRLVDGTADPQEWAVDRSKLEALARSGEGTMTAHQAVQVARVALDLEALRGAPQDVEWAVAGEMIHVLQSRPITVVPTPPAETLDGTGWEKDTAHYPEQISPFGASVYQASIEEAARVGMCEPYGLVAGGVEYRTAGGETYMRIVPLFGPADTKGRKAPPAWVLGLIARLHPALRAANRRAAKAVDSGMLAGVFDRWDHEWRAALDAEGDRLRATDLALLDDRLLVEHLTELRAHAAEGQRIHFSLFVPYGVALAELDEHCRRALGWTTAETMRLLQGLSRASVHGRDELAPIAESLDDASRVALDRHPDQPVHALRGVDPVAADRLAAWLDVHGWRCLNYDPGSPTLAERPALVTRMLVDGVSVSPDSAATRRAAEDDARRRLAGADLADFDERLAVARRAYPNREENVVSTDNLPSGLIRRWVVEAGRRMVARGVLARRDDVTWLSVDEIITALSGATNDLSAAIVRRKSEYAWVRSHPGPEFVGERDEMPDISALPAPMRRTNAALLWLVGQEYPAQPTVVKADALVSGNPASPGTVTGRARIVLGESDFSKIGPGDVMVSPITTPAWTMLFSTAAAVVTDGGGVLSHAAIVAREHGIPAVIGAPGATSTIADGQLVTVDGSTGLVTAAH